MKTIAYFYYLTLFLLSLCLTGCQDSTEFYTLDGERHQISDYRGQWLVVNFFAEWCAPCREEVPELNNAWLRYKTQNLQLLGVSFDRIDNGKISAIATSWGINYPLMATEPMPVLPFSLPDKLPTTYLIGPDGKLKHQFEGKITAQEILSVIRAAK